MKTIIQFFTVIQIILNVYSCSPQKSDLPLEIPNNLQISFSENGGMSPYGMSILLSADSCIYYVQEINREQQRIKFQIDSNKLNDLYQTCREFSLDKIKHKKPSHTVYDAGSEGISIYAEGISFHVTSGANFPFENQKHALNYWKIKNKIFDIFAVAAAANKKDKKVMDKMNQLTSLKTIGHEAVGVAGIKSDEFLLFESLENELSEDEWVLLCNHSNRVVTAYACWALLRKNSKKVINILSEKYYDKTNVNVANGCKTLIMPINKWLAEMIKAYPLNDLTELEQKRIDYCLEQIEKK